MTKEQMVKIMQYFQTAYDGFNDGKDERMVLTVWYDAFQNEDASIVSQAAKEYVSRNEFKPTIAGLRKYIDMIKSPNATTDLWALINKAASNSLYNAEEEFSKLPPVCQSFVGSPAALKDLAQTDVGTMNTVVKGQFLKRAEDIREHKEVQMGLPAEVRQAIAMSKERAMLEGGWY